MHIEKLIVNREVTYENGDVTHWTVDILTETEEGTYRIYNPFTDLYEYFQNVADTRTRYLKLSADIETLQTELTSKLALEQQSVDDLKAKLELKNKTVVSSIISIGDTN